MKKLLTLSLSSLMLLGAYSCGNNGCDETRETIFYADLRSSYKNRQINSMTVWYRDTLHTTYSNPTSFELVLPPDSGHYEVRIDMTVKDDSLNYQVSDTLGFRYESFPYLINMECGCTVFFSINEVTSTEHFLKDITLINKDITNEEDVNLRIVY
ncbi:MAG: DUF6452 family protein [Bacteroidales bacterium]|nr:DUF6452 family protein [Bacteroidales bacterium]